MTLGQEFAEFVAELINTDGDFGSTMTWRHVSRVENTNGLVVVTNTDEVFRGGVTDPVRTKLFSDAATALAVTAVVIPAGALTTEPELADSVAVRAGKFLRVLELKEILGPGDTGAPVLICHVAAVGG